jgi:Sec-independent protein translocase protein TatA
VTLRIKIAAIALLIVGGIALYVAWKYHVEQLGAARVETRDMRAALEAKQRELDQIQRDSKTNEDAVNALQAEKDRLAATLADQPAPVIRMCEPARSGRLPAAAVPPGKPSEAAADRGGSASVPVGDQSGIDVGPGLLVIAEVADRLAAQDRALLKREARLEQPD